MSTKPTSFTSRQMVLVFTDIAGSVALKNKLGNVAYSQLISRHDATFKDAVSACPGAEIIKDTGDGFLARFPSSSSAVSACLRFQHALHTESWVPVPVLVRMGIHIGEVAELEKEVSGLPKLVGMAADIAARIMGLAVPGQILMTRTVFDDARMYVREHPLVAAAGPLPALEWKSHGLYLFKGSDEPIDLYEIGAVGIAPLCRPPDSEKAWRYVIPGNDGNEKRQGIYGAVTPLPLEVPSTRTRVDSKRMVLIRSLSVGLVCVLLALTAASFLHFRTSLNTPEQIAELYKPRVYGLKSESGAGSGILIANNSTEGLIVTNTRAINPKPDFLPEDKQRAAARELLKVKITAKTSMDPTIYDVQLAAIHPGWDAALLVIEIRAEGSDFLPVAKQKSLKLEEGVVALWYGRNFEFSSGRISSTSSESGFIRTTSPLGSANSGSPLFLTRGGLLAGISAIDPAAEDLPSAIPVEQLISSLKTDSWEWALDEKLKMTTLELAACIPFED